LHAARQSESSDWPASDAEKRDQLNRLLADYNAVGITSIADRDAGDEAVELYKSLKERGETVVPGPF